MSRYLLDANVLIALTVAEHEHHEAASAWLAATRDFAVCPMVEGALMRYLLRVGESMATADAVLRGVHASSRCAFWPDSISYLDINSPGLSGHRQVTDTYLAALARSHGERVATLDAAMAARHPADSLLVPRRSDRSLANP